MKDLIRNLIAMFFIVMFVTVEIFYFKFNSDVISNKLLIAKEFLSTKLLKNNSNESFDSDIDYNEMIESIENSNNNVISKNSEINYDDTYNIELQDSEVNKNLDKEKNNIDANNNSAKLKEFDSATDSVIEKVENENVATVSNLVFGDIIENEAIEIPIANDGYGLEDDKTYIFATVSEAYFKNTLFIGDSRTVGFHIYKTLPGATYYANQSFGVFSGFDRTMELPKFGVITLGNLLYSHKFDKIYICLGINNLGTGIPNHKKVYERFLNIVRDLQPQAIIFLLSNMHVTKAQSASTYVNNENINLVNDFIKGFADNKKTFYLDTCFLYDDEEGNLSDEYCYDGYHIKAKYYDKYLEFLLGHGAVLQENK